MRHWKGLAVAALLLGVAACGSSDGGSDAGASDTTAGSAATTAAATPDSSDAGATTTAASGDTTPSNVSTTPESGDVEPGGSMTVAFRQDIVGGIDPHGESTSATAELWMTGLMYETLVRYAPGFEFQPLLATSWEVSDDLLTWTFQLREGVTFSDGAVFNADAVKANFDHIFAVGTSAQATLGPFFGPENVEVVDDYTVAFHLKQPYSLFPALMGSFPTLMASPDAIASGVDLTKTAVGTGPFLFDSFSPGVEIKYSKNPTYWRKDDNGVQLPYLDAITFRVITDASQRLNAIRTGETDVAMFLDSSQEEQLGDAVAVVDPTSRLGVLTFNSTVEPLDDPNVRRAISLALDRDALLQVSQNGVGEAAFGLFPSTSAYYDPAVETPEGAPYSHRNVEEAKKLLAEAGYPDGVDLSDRTLMAQAEWPDMVRAAEAALQMLDEAGIHIGEVQVCPLAECGSIRKSGDWLGTTFAFPMQGDPYFTFEALYASTGRYNYGNGASENRWNLGEDVDAAIKAPLDVPAEDRFDLAREAQQKVLEAQPGSAIQMFFMPQFDAVGPNVVNYDVRPYNLQRNWSVVGFAAS